MKAKTIRILSLLSFLILFAAFFYFYLSALKLWDYDFWWHAATGRYIVTEGHLPEEDPFSFTSTMEENKNPFPEREKFFLKQYWLTQVLFYIIFDYTGPTGMIILRAVLLFFTALIIYWRLQRSGVSFYISFVFLFIFFMTSMRSLGERPVLFSILFTSVVLFLLEDFKDRKGKTLFLLIPVMLLWANMHGAFILGVIIISVFMFGEALKVFFKKSSLTKREMKIFYGATGLALIFSFINPTGWDAFFMALSPKYDIFLKGIQEYHSPYYFYINKIRAFDYSYVTITLMFPVILILRNRKIGLIQLILLSGFFVMSLRASRYGIFYAIVGSMIMGKEFNAFITEVVKKRVSEEFYKKIEYVFAIAVLISISLFIAGYFKYEPIKFGIANTSSVPEAAVNFIEKNKIQGNMFNDYGFGGYIIWRLYPQKNFIDSRTMNRIVMDEYGWVIDAMKKVEGIKTTNDKIPLWETLLNHYKINFVFMSLIDIHGQVFPLILELAESDKWVPIYLDPMSVIFIKNTADNSDIISKFKVPEDAVYNMLIAKSTILAIDDRLNPRHFISLGYIFSKLGRNEDALKAYRYAFERWKDPELEKKIKEIDAEFEKQNKSIDAFDDSRK